MDFDALQRATEAQHVKFETFKEDCVWISGHRLGGFFLDGWRRYDWTKQSFFESWGIAWTSGTQPNWTDHAKTQRGLLALHDKMKSAHDPREAMTASELATLDALRYPLTLFRGVGLTSADDLITSGNVGNSWTTKREKAQWFATRQRPELAALLSVTIDRPPLAYFDRRREDEIVINGNRLTGVCAHWLGG
jgi:hypothetical protein